MKPTPPNRPEHLPLEHQPLPPRKPKIHRIFLPVSQYSAIDRNQNMVYRINPIDRLKDLVAGDLLIFEKLDEFTKKPKGKIKTFVIGSVDFPNVDLLTLVTSDVENANS